MNPNRQFNPSLVNRNRSFQPSTTTITITTNNDNTIIIITTVHIRRLELLGAAVAAVASTAVYAVTVREYRRLAASTHNAAVTEEPYGTQLDWQRPPFWEQFQCVLLYWMTRWTRQIHRQPYALVVEPHKYIPRLLRTRAAKASEVPTKSNKPKAPLVIGTIRKYSSLLVTCVTDCKNTKICWDNLTLSLFFASNAFGSVERNQ